MDNLSKRDRYALRFEEPGHRDRLKLQAVQAKRTLNRHILLLIEEGERARARLEQETAQ